MNRSIEIKNHLHQLIDKINNNDLLEMVYELLNSKTVEKEHELIDKLTIQEKEELYKSYDESFDDSNLIDLDKIKDKHSRWGDK